MCLKITCFLKFSPHFLCEFSEITHYCTVYRSLQTISLIVGVQHIITMWKLCGGWVLTPGVCVSRHWKCSFSRVFVWKMVNEIKLQVLTNRGYASNVFHNCYTRLLPYYEPTNVGNECLVGEIELKNKNVPKIDFSPAVNWPLCPRNTWIRHELYINRNLVS